MSSLFNLTKETLSLCNSLISGEPTPEQEAMLTDLCDVRIPAKVEGYCQVLTTIDREIGMFDAEIERLKVAKQTRENAVKRMKERLRDAMNELDMKTIKAGTFTATVCKNSTPSVITDLPGEAMPEKFRKVTVEVNKSALTHAWKAGEPLPEGVTVEQGTHVRIR